MTASLMGGGTIMSGMSGTVAVFWRLSLAALLVMV